MTKRHLTYMRHITRLIIRQVTLQLLKYKIPYFFKHDKIFSQYRHWLMHRQTPQVKDPVIISVGFFSTVPDSVFDDPAYTRHLRLVARNPRFFVMDSNLTPASFHIPRRISKRIIRGIVQRCVGLAICQTL
jgi:hypothetical protein